MCDGVHPNPITHHPSHTLSKTATYVDGLALPPEWGRMKMYRIDRHVFLYNCDEANETRVLFEPASLFQGYKGMLR